MLQGVKDVMCSFCGWLEEGRAVKRPRCPVSAQCTEGQPGQAQHHLGVANTVSEHSTAVFPLLLVQKDKCF